MSLLPDPAELHLADHTPDQDDSACSPYRSNRHNRVRREELLNPDLCAVVCALQDELPKSFIPYAYAACGSIPIPTAAPATSHRVKIINPAADTAAPGLLQPQSGQVQFFGTPDRRK